ncbi:MAG: hypothetical protein ACPGLV_01605 [Bacteroidia bacterium]
MRLTILLLALMYSTYGWGQKNKSDYSFLKKAYTNELWFQTVSEFGYTDLLYKDPSDFYEPETTYYYVNLFAAEVEQKLRLIQIHDFLSFSISLNESVQFRVVEDGTTQNRTLLLGATPFADINLFNHATYNSDHRFGLFVGMGYRAGYFLSSVWNVSSQPFYSPRIRVGLNQTLSFRKNHFLSLAFYFGLKDIESFNDFDLLHIPNDFFGVSFQYRQQNKNSIFY